MYKRQLQECARLSIDASWAGAELQTVDVVVLRAELGAHVPEARSLPPTAVGSIPQLAEQLSAPAPGAARIAGSSENAAAATAAAAEAEEKRTVGRRDLDGTHKRRFVRSMRHGLMTLALGIIAFAVADLLHLAAVIALLWVVAAVCFVLAMIAGNRALANISKHPSRALGVPAAAVVLLLGGLGLAGIGLSVWTVARTAPAKDAPIGIGKLNATNELRWGYQRLNLVAKTSWEEPGRDLHSCWRFEGRATDRKRPERAEIGGTSATCSQPHRGEVVVAYEVDHDADSPYPGARVLRAGAVRRCAPQLVKINRAGGLTGAAAGSLRVEIPTEQGWIDADHDVVCLAITATRSTPLPRVS